MKSTYLFLMLLVGNLCCVCAQNKTIDSLQQLTYNELKEKFYTYYQNIKVDKVKIIAKYYLQKAKKEKNQLKIADGYVLVHFNENLPKALEYLDSIEPITKDLKGTIYPSYTYLMKGNLYYKHDHLKLALDNYVLALKYAKEQKDQKLTEYANINIAYLNSYIGENVEAAKIFRYYLYNGKNMNEYQHNQMRVSLIYCYLRINKLDSASVLIKEGKSSSFIDKNEYSVGQYSYFSGDYNVKQKNYKTAITELSKAYQYFTSVNDTNANYALFSLGKAYDGLNNKEKAVEHFIKLDANIQKTNKTYPELREVYDYLINYYKEQDDKEKQLYYIDRFLKVNKKLDEQFRYLATELPKKYETPKLLEEKEDIINDLKNEKIIFYASIIALSVTLLLLVYLYYKAKKTAQEHRKIAQELIHRVEKRNLEPIAIKKETPELPQVVEDIEIEKVISKVVAEDVTVFILKELETFENKELFLKNGITLATLAKKIKTNTSYLSETINNHKGKNFNSYLNDLRIDYVLERLVKDKKFRLYKLPAIAEEIGYNNVQAFSVAFKKKTGTTPSVYIKEIEKSKTV